MSIVRRNDGKFQVWVSIQDGTEDCGCYNTLYEARQAFLDGENVLNHRQWTFKDVEDVTYSLEPLGHKGWQVIWNLGALSMDSKIFYSEEALHDWLELHHNDYDGSLELENGLIADEVFIVVVEISQREQYTFQRYMENNLGHLVRSKDEIKSELEELKKKQARLEKLLEATNLPKKKRY